MVKDRVPTIVALSTPSGFGGIAVIRMSGSRTLPIVQDIFSSKNKIQPQRAIYGYLSDKKGYIDTAVVTYFKAPRSYTGEDLVEISLHGNPYLCELTINACKEYGAIGASPGEFTQRAFLNGKIDLSQAEGVADIIYASSRAAQSASANLLQGYTGKIIQDFKQSIIDLISLLELELDFQEDEIQFTPRGQIEETICNLISEIKTLIESYNYGKIVRNGALCPIIGPPNSGKSSLFNAFLQEERVIVSPSPGTTRDFIEESVRIDKYSFRLVDTAGIRDSGDPIELAGVARSRNLLKRGDLILYVLDLADRDIKLTKRSGLGNPKNIFFILNKSDIANKDTLAKYRKYLNGHKYFICSAKKRIGIHAIASAMSKHIDKLHPSSDTIFITRLRHLDALKQTLKGLELALKSAHSNNPSEIIVIDLRAALNGLDAILGKTTSDDILSTIFSQFCIGK
jgi:tRNA modification GTPase